MRGHFRHDIAWKFNVQRKFHKYGTIKNITYRFTPNPKEEFVSIFLFFGAAKSAKI